MINQYILEIFQESLKSPESVKMYTFIVKKFMKYHGIKDFDSVVKIEKSELQKMVETYVIYLKKPLSKVVYNEYERQLTNTSS